MKSQHLIAMGIVRPASCVHISRDEWEIEIIREPRPSCVTKWKWRNQLRDMNPGTRETINGVDVYRKNLAHQASRYQVNGAWLTVTETIAAIEAGNTKQPTGRAVQMALPLDIQEAS